MKQEPGNFLCGYGCRRQSMMDLVDENRRCFKHGAVYVRWKAAPSAYIGDIPLTELLEGV